jgi:hypothetical protein
VPVEVDLAGRRGPDGKKHFLGRELLMKKMIVAAMLALAVTAAGQQKASAWSKFTFGVGLNISYESTGSCFQWGGLTCLPNPSPYCGGYCPSYPGYPVPAPAFAPHPPVVPVAPAVAAPQNRTQQVGYYFYSQGYAPSYWYGY